MSLFYLFYSYLFASIILQTVVLARFGLALVSVLILGEKMFSHAVSFSDPMQADQPRCGFGCVVFDVTVYAAAVTPPSGPFTTLESSMPGPKSETRRRFSRSI